MAKRSRGRRIDGILVLDKPEGQSSNKALQTVKRLFQAEKAGHTGSLDPLATGVLPLCLGEGTKVSQFLLDSDKVYRARVLLGVTTATGDSEGEVLSRAEVPALDLSAVEAVLSRFRGEITQIPPAYSALKQNGVPLYKLARAGKEIEHKERRVTIYRLELLGWQSPELELEVACSKGTYIRTLAEDIGRALGCGAHITALRRIKAGPFSLGQAHTPEQLQALAEAGLPALDALLLAPDSAIDWMPALKLSEADACSLCQGRQVFLQDTAPAELLRLYEGERFIGIGTLADDGRLGVVRLLRQD